jgi:glycosyltransferase involved in cell wall biosynthesis
MRVRILFINSIRMYGGGEVWMVTAMKMLVQRGHKVFLICRSDAPMRPYAEATGATVVPMTIRGDFDPRCILRTSVLLRRQRIDAVLTNTDKELRFAGLAARLAHKPPVFARKGVDRPLKNKWRYRWTYNTLAAAVIANSEATKRTLMASAPWLDASRVHVIYNGIDPDRYGPEYTRSIRGELAIPSGVPLIGFVGRLNVQKGIEYLLQAFVSVIERRPDAHLLMVGVGDLHDYVLEFVHQHGLESQLHLTGFRDDIPNVMDSIDVCVLPSLWEGFGIVLIEAMAAGKPCVTTNISSMPEIVQHDVTGLVVPPHNADALAQALLKILDDRALATRLGMAGRQDVLQKFSIDRMIENYERVFAQYITKSW